MSQRHRILQIKLKNQNSPQNIIDNRPKSTFIKRRYTNEDQMAEKNGRHQEAHGGKGNLHSVGGNVN